MNNEPFATWVKWLPTTTPNPWRELIGPMVKEFFRKNRSEATTSSHPSKPLKTIVVKIGPRAPGLKKLLLEFA
jgi:hypothetical protein